nr:Imm26 family immunity protein [Paenibacillus maysiensis]
MVFKRIKHREGDIFVIPLHGGRFAVCQVICTLYGRFKKAFSFGEKEERIWSKSASKMNMDINMTLAP